MALGPRDKELYGVSRKFLTQRVQEAKAALARDTGGPTSQPSQPVAKDQLAGADKMMSEGNYKGAFVAYSKIAQAEPGNVRALVGKALAGWEAVGDQDRPAALGLLDNIAKRTDLSPQDLDKLGRLYLERVKDPARAKAIWTRLASENPEYAASVKLGERLKDL